MKLVVVDGLLSTGRDAVAPPLLAVLEVEGAVLSWVVDEPTAGAEFTFTDVGGADWLYRAFGDAGHVALVASSGGGSSGVDLAGVEPLPGALDALRRLAVGHWLRRWWPAGLRDGIAELDRVVLDAEVALLTAAAQHFFGCEESDAEVVELLAPLGAEIVDRLRGGDPRVIELLEAAVELAADLGVDGPGWDGAYGAADTPVATAALTRDDFALAAGPGDSRGATSIARGTATVMWSAVPPGVFDAAEDTVAWSIEQSGDDVIAVVTAALTGGAVAEGGSPAGIAVALRSGGIVATGTLDARGAAALPLLDSDRPLTETAAWGHDWSSTTVTVGARADESPEVRQRVRAFARARLAGPGPDAYLAEVLAAESDY